MGKTKNTKSIIETRINRITDDLLNYREKTEYEYSIDFGLSVRQIRRYRKIAIKRLNRYRSDDSIILKAALNKLLMDKLTDENLFSQETTNTKLKIIDRLIKLNFQDNT